MEGLLLPEPVELIRIQRNGSAAFKCCVAETQGRRPNHEDAHAMRCNRRSGDFWVLDGHRGINAAHFGAAALSQVVGTAVKKGKLPTDEHVQQAFMSVDSELQGHLAEKRLKHSEGTTVIGALVAKNPNGNYSIKLLNCGDSRGIVVHGPGKEEVSETEVPVKLPQYLERDTDTEAFVAGGASWLPMWPAIVESIDHKPYHPTEKARIEAAGGHVRGGRRARVDGQLSVSRSLGDFDFKDNIDRAVEEQKITCMPDIYDISGVPPGTLVILGCDGLWDVMSSEKVVAFVRARLQRDPKVDLGDVAADLVRASVRKRSTDNVTVMIAELADGSAWENSQDEMQDFERLQDQKFFDEDLRTQYMNFLNHTGFPSEPRLCPQSQRWFLGGAQYPNKKKGQSRRATYP